MLDEEEPVAMTHAINSKGVLSIALAFKCKSNPMVRVYKSNKKTPFTLNHHHLTTGT